VGKISGGKMEGGMGEVGEGGGLINILHTGEAKKKDHGREKRANKTRCTKRERGTDRKSPLQTGKDGWKGNQTKTLTKAQDYGAGFVTGW